MTLEPGIFTWSWEKYFACDAVNSSTLKWGKKSCAHMKVAKDGVFDNDTDAKKFGRIIHTAVFEPKAYSRIPVSPFPDFRTKDAQEWRKVNPTYLTVQDTIDIKAIVKNIYSHKEAKRILSLEGKGEQSLVVLDEETGLMLKARIDWLSPIVLDGKSTVDASPDLHGFPKQCALYRYHVQQAFYQRVLRLLKYPHQGFIFLAFERTPPYAVTTIELDKMSVEKGEEEVSRLLHLYKECQETNSWPAYSEKIEPVTIPQWALKEQPYESAFGYALEEQP